jgi:glycosyltransferase involved in cell wall biosynthesis
MADQGRPNNRQSIAFISDYVPRQCGIATFTHDLCEAVAAQGGKGWDVFTVAMNDVPEGYPYPERVRFEVRQAVQADYKLAADFLNIHGTTTVCLQHEYGIFGGTCGSNILGLLRRLRRPLVTTLHTVLKQPNDQQLLVMKEIGKLSSRLVVMSSIAHQILHDVYDIPMEKIVTVPHGIPDVPFVDPNFFKDHFGVEGRKVMLTFGLLSPGKGIEYAVEALPAVVARHPEFVYIVLGATHPHVKRESGEEYRNGLIRRATELGVKDNLLFVNRFVHLQELCEYLGAADLYVTPYLGESQITSGTLAYALGSGKCVISTPYWYATELLADGRGRLVPFRNSQAISEQILDLLDNETELHAIRKRAYTYTRTMTWNRVGQAYLDVFREATEAWVDKQHRGGFASSEEAQKLDELPEVDLRHLRVLTDDTGVLQHSLYCTPDRTHGYCCDDNARALIVAAMYWDQTHDDSAIPMMHTYLAFLSHAFNEETRRFRNFMRYDRTWSEPVGSEDSHGRAMWGLGQAVALCPHQSMIALATRLFKEGLGTMERFSSPRAWAFAIVGIHAYLRRFGGDSEVRRWREKLTDKLAGLFRDNMTGDWPWCENVVTYSNAKLPHALLMSGKWMRRNDVIDMGKSALSWLLDVQTNADGMLSIVGTDGWYPRDGAKASFDQQPVEAHALVDACIEAYHVTREDYWIEQARKAFHWFLGDNDLRTPIYDFTTGGCRDGLHADRVNENQGAESTLAWLMSLLLMHDLETEQTLGELGADKTTGRKPVKKAIASSGPVVGVKVKEHAPANSDDK